MEQQQTGNTMCLEESDTQTAKDSADANTAFIGQALSADGEYASERDKNGNIIAESHTMAGLVAQIAQNTANGNSGFVSVPYMKVTDIIAPPIDDDGNYNGTFTLKVNYNGAPIAHWFYLDFNFLYYNGPLDSIETMQIGSIIDNATGLPIDIGISEKTPFYIQGYRSTSGSFNLYTIKVSKVVYPGIYPAKVASYEDAGNVTYQAISQLRTNPITLILTKPLILIWDSTNKRTIIGLDADYSPSDTQNAQIYITAAGYAPTGGRVTDNFWYDDLPNPPTNQHAQFNIYSYEELIAQHPEALSAPVTWGFLSGENNYSPVYLYGVNASLASLKGGKIIWQYLLGYRNPNSAPGQPITIPPSWTPIAKISMADQAKADLSNVADNAPADGQVLMAKSNGSGGFAYHWTALPSKP